MSKRKLTLKRKSKPKRSKRKPMSGQKKDYRKKIYQQVINYNSKFEKII